MIDSFLKFEKNGKNGKIDFDEGRDISKVENIFLSYQLFKIFHFLSVSLIIVALINV